MESHLANLTEALNGIALLHEKALNRPAKPFTSAILNTEKLDVLDFIRDADEFESNLFWYPTSKVGETIQLGEELNLEPKIPEPKAFIPPSPVRAIKKNSIEYDAKTLLKAAQRLLENYHNAPRAKKHVKSLVKKHLELQKSISESNEKIINTSNLITILQSQGKDFAANKQTQSLLSSIKREEMEIFAFEQTLEELQQQKIQLKAQANLASSKSVPEEEEEREEEELKIKSNEEISIADEQEPSILARDVEIEEEEPIATGAAAAAGSSSFFSKQDSPEKSQNLISTFQQEQPSVYDYADETIRLKANSDGIHETEINSIQSSDQSPNEDQERFCKRIWENWNENLEKYFIIPSNKEISFEKTFQLLENLSNGKNIEKLNSYPDNSIVISSKILLILMKLKSINQELHIENLKEEIENWWILKGGQKNYISNAPKDFKIQSIDDLKSLIQKSIYNFVSKKLIRIRFSGGDRMISLPIII